MKTKSILIVTNYFPPEKGAAANRIYSLTKGLSDAGHKVTVVCPLPNYPEGEIFSNYKKKVFSKEVIEGITIYRLWVWPSNSSNKFVRLASMLSFSWSLSMFLLFKKTSKKIFVQYSPVFIGFTAIFWGILLGKKCLLNVSDLWPLAGLEMGLLKKGFYYSLLTRMERFCYKKAHFIVGQSQEIIDYVKQLGVKTPTFLYRNFPSFELPEVSEKQNNTNIKIVYAGLLGVAQGLQEICTNVDFSEQVSLHIYGSGPQEKQIAALQKDHIYFYGSIDRTVLLKELQQYDIAFIPLTKRIYGSVPSKIFEYTRLGIPVLYNAGGEGEHIVNDIGLGWTLPENDLRQLQGFIKTISVDDLIEFPKKEIQKKAVKEFDFLSQLKNFDKRISAI